MDYNPTCTTGYCNCIAKDKRIEKLETALRKIAEYRTHCIYSEEAYFREGSNAAFVRMADIARAAIDAARKEIK